MKIELKDTEIQGIYAIGEYYIWLTEDGSLRECVYYTSIEEAKKDHDEYFGEVTDAVNRYWAMRYPE